MSGAVYSQMSGAKSASPFSAIPTPGLKGQMQDIDYSNVDLDASFDFDAETDESRPRSAYDHSGKALYLDACKRFNIVPVSYFLRHMGDKKLVLQHHYLGDLGIRALCLTLMVSCLFCVFDHDHADFRCLFYASIERFTNGKLEIWTRVFLCFFNRFEIGCDLVIYALIFGYILVSHN